MNLLLSASSLKVFKAPVHPAVSAVAQDLRNCQFSPGWKDTEQIREKAGGERSIKLFRDRLS